MHRFPVGLPDYFLFIDSDEATDGTELLTDSLNATVVTFGTDKGIVLKLRCNHKSYVRFGGVLVPLEYGKAIDFTTENIASHNACYR